MPAVKIREGLTEVEAFAIEIALIAAIGREASGGPLVNLTDGGEGGLGLSRRGKMPSAQRQKLREHRLGLKASDETRALNRRRALENGSRPPSRAGKIDSSETREKKRAASLRNGNRPPSSAGRPLTEAHKLKISAARRSQSAPLACPQEMAMDVHAAGATGE